MADRSYARRWRHLPYTAQRKKAWDAYQQWVAQRRSEHLAEKTQHPATRSRLRIAERYRK